MNQFQTIRSLQTHYEPEVNYRFNCPFCNGKNTLSVTKIRNEYIWNCYKNSCNAKGRKATSLSLSDLRTKPKIVEQEQFVILSSFISPIWHPEAVEYMNRMHCMRAWSEGMVQMYYDPPQDRVVFIITDRAGTVIDANGRSLQNRQPKWLRYGKSRMPFVCNRDTDTIVVVEDVASACAVYPYYAGIALLGTNLTIAAANELKHYAKVIVALDPDAQSKALDMRSKLAYICNSVTTKLIPNDLKYYNPEQIRGILSDD